MRLKVGAQVGSQVGAYRLVDKIGEGGMGSVFLAEHVALGRRAAIKLLHAWFGHQPDIVVRFFNEARAAAAISDPGIVQIFDFGQDVDGAPYIVMELLEGESLAARLRRRRLAPGEALAILRQVASTLGVAHRRGIVHRDLKPENIFLVRDPEVAGGERTKVLDFGIAKLTGDPSSKTRTDAVMGTPMYMSPEQCRGAGNIDQRSDVYSLGCILFELVAGTPPFVSDGLGDIIAMHLREPAPALASRAPGVSAELEVLAQRCLAKAPGDRYASGAELAAAISRVLASTVGVSAQGDPGLGIAVPPTSEPAPRGPMKTEMIAPGGDTVPRLPVTAILPSESGATPGPAEPMKTMIASDATTAPTTARDAAPTTARDAAPTVVPSLQPTVILESRSAGLAADAFGAPDALPSREPPALPGDARLPMRPPSGGPAPPPSPPSATGTAPPFPPMFPREPLRWITRLIPPLAPRDREHGDGFAAAFADAVPPSMRDSLASFVAFFRELFATASRFEAQAIQLGEPVFEDLAPRPHYVLFIDDARTVAFRAGVAPLAEQLRGLGTPSGSVVIAVIAGLELGQGSRETIFTLRKERNLFVVPIAASEIRRACETGTAQPLLFDRIADLHTVSDPFAVSGDFTDPTRCIGFAREVAEIINHVTAGGRIVSVAGPPGSGKSTVVAMAEYGCDNPQVARRFIRLSCSELVGRDPLTLMAELHEQIRPPGGDLAGQPSAVGTNPPPPSGVSIHKTIMMLGVSPGPAGAAPEKRHQLVIVLEDADWLLRLASSAESDAQRRARTRELWRSLAQLCALHGHTVIVTSIRDFELLDQGPGERPVTISQIPLGSLGPRESDRLITALGEPVGFAPTRRALAALHRISGGNIYALRLLCSTIIRTARDRPGYSPLARLEVTRRMVMRAADEIAETGVTFRPHVEGWLDHGERIVLQHIARARPRSPRAIRRALEGGAADIRIGEALDGLERMHLIERRGRRHRVRVPLFERWINTHLEAPAQLRRARKQAQVRWLLLGGTCAVLLFIAYWTWLRSTRTPEPALLGDCTFELDHPDRVGSDEMIVLNVFQECKTPAPHALAIEPVMSSLTIQPPTTNCTASPRSCTTTFTSAAGPQSHDEYRVRLRVDDRPLVSASIKKDGFASVRAFGEKTVPVLAVITALLTAVGVFHKELWRSVAQLVGRGPPAAPPGEARA